MSQAGTTSPGRRPVGGPGLPSIRRKWRQPVWLSGAMQTDRFGPRTDLVALPRPPPAPAGSRPHGLGLPCAVREGLHQLARGHKLGRTEPGAGRNEAKRQGSSQVNPAVSALSSHSSDRLAQPRPPGRSACRTRRSVQVLIALRPRLGRCFTTFLSILFFCLRTTSYLSFLDSKRKMFHETVAATRPLVKECRSSVIIRLLSNHYGPSPCRHSS
jgi:hypothetical protein